MRIARRHGGLRPVSPGRPLGGVPVYPPLAPPLGVPRPQALRSPALATTVKPGAWCQCNFAGWTYVIIGALHQLGTYRCCQTGGMDDMCVVRLALRMRAGRTAPRALPGSQHEIFTNGHWQSETPHFRPIYCLAGDVSRCRRRCPFGVRPYSPPYICLHVSS